MKYAHIISEMTWSYSRIKSYEDCHYRFYLKYIKGISGTPLFFANYGSFLHEIIAKYLIGELKMEQLVPHYLINFGQSVGPERAPSAAVFTNYFNQGLDYLKNINIPSPKETVLGVEKYVEFQIENKPFVGYVDAVFEKDGRLIILDNKSRALKNRSGKLRPTKTDQELNDYLRQLYLYSIAIWNEFGVPPEVLKFNCFRTKNIISEVFVLQALESAKSWALEKTDQIENENDWSPDIEFFKCRYICEMHDHCEYCKMFS